jgi:putative intracellular protease/amidase
MAKEAEMSRYRLIALCAVLLLLVVGCKSAPKQVLLILQETSGDMELMLTKEVGVMVSMLEKGGYKVVTASATGQPLTGAGGTTRQPDLKLADVKADDYVGVILPCMASADATRGYGTIPSETIEIVAAAAAAGKPVAAQVSAVEILGRAGVLDGKQFAIAADSVSLVPKGIYKGIGVVQDGNIITSGTCPLMALYTGEPDGTRELTQKFIDSLASAR